MRVYEKQNEMKLQHQKPSLTVGKQFQSVLPKYIHVYRKLFCKFITYIHRDIPKVLIKI